MKLLVLILAVIIMSFSEPIYAQSKAIEMKSMDVVGFVDQEYEQLKTMSAEVDATSNLTDEKINFIEDMIEKAPEIVEKQIEIFQKKKQLFELWEIRDKLIVCMQKKNRDCNKFKQELKSKQLSLSGSDPDENQVQFEVTNLFIINKMKECSEVARELYPSFRAVIELDFTLDNLGRPMNAFINQEKSAISHDLFMFPKCVEHFARKLHFTNNSQKIASFSKNFIL